MLIDYFYWKLILLKLFTNLIYIQWYKKMKMQIQIFRFNFSFGFNLIRSVIVAHHAATIHAVTNQDSTRDTK